MNKNKIRINHLVRLISDGKKILSLGIVAKVILSKNAVILINPLTSLF